MWLLTIVFGLALIALGGIGYGFPGASARSLTAWIPSAIGAVLLICGILARKDAYRKHVMHVAVLVGLIGFLIAAIRLGMTLPTVLSEGTFLQNRATQMVTLMAVICLVFVALCINSFVQARILRRKVGTPDPHALP